MGEEERQPEIEYPCRWSYRVIGRDKELVRGAVETVIVDKEYLLTYSNRSRTGKYHSWNVELVVESQLERDTLFVMLKEHPEVKMVI